jgi:hypothetical protein
MSINEVLRCFQCHTIGVSGPIRKLLRRVAREVVCYVQQLRGGGGESVVTVLQKLCLF